MKEEHWDLIKTIVDKALTLSGVEKSTYLSTACRENPEICAEIEELLRSIEESEADCFMKPVRQDRKELVSDLSDELERLTKDKEFIGKQIGPYRIIEQLGSGGMGAVFKAERVDGEFQHQVAIKLIKKDVDSEENIRRFRIEREILATLHHPNIAQLHDGSVTEGGIPYLIMEYIDGMSIDRYCNEQRLTINERLNLFKDVCQAVQFAHTNLVVHRDLKAQNIYVTSEGVVKILDFGIAKLLDGNFTEMTLLETRPGQKFWTPQYAAPEQVMGKPITTATDIYALGVLLHKLLTDSYPLDLEGKNLAEIELIIKEGSPLSLSQSFLNHPSPQECVPLRKTTVTELTKNLRGDLDALVLKAIRKEPEYRYNSVSQLLEDIERYQSGLPLVARKGTLRYRTAKFIRRHRVGLATAVIFLIATIGFTGFYTWQITEERDRVQLERDKSEQVTEFLTDLFRASNPIEAQGDNLTGLELLERGIGRAEELKEQPAIQSEMLYVIGNTYRGMNRPDEARPLLEKALKLQREYWQKDHVDIAFTLNSLGSVHWLNGEVEPAEVYLKEALDMRRRLHGDQHPDVFTSMNNFALLLKDKGELDEAEKLYEETLEARKKYYGTEHPKIGVSLNNLAFFVEERGNLAKAETYYREAIAMWRKIQGDDHTDVAVGMTNLAVVLNKRGNLDEAEMLLKKSIDIRQKVFGEEHVQVGWSLNNLAIVQKDRKNFKAAELTAGKALNMFYNIHGDDAIHQDIANSLRVHGEVYKVKGDLQKAEEYHLRALAMRRKLFDDNHMYIAYSLRELGSLYIAKQEPAKAEPMLRQALAIYQNFLPADDWRIALLKGTLGTCLLDQTRYQDAESLLIKKYENLRTVNGIEERYLHESLHDLVTLYEEWGKPEMAELYKEQLALAAKDEL